MKIQRENIIVKDFVMDDTYYRIENNRSQYIRLNIPNLFIDLNIRELKELYEILQEFFEEGK